METEEKGIDKERSRYCDPSVIRCFEGGYILDTGYTSVRVTCPLLSLLKLNPLCYFLYLILDSISYRRTPFTKSISHKSSPQKREVNTEKV